MVEQDFDSKQISLEFNPDAFGGRLRGRTPLTRRQFLQVAAVATVGATLQACQKKGKKIIETVQAITTEVPLANKLSVEVVVVKEKEKPTPISFGFNTHLSAKPADIENLTIDAFKEDVDTMVAYGMDCVRLNVWEWELDDASLGVYKEALGYAKDRGINVHLVTSVPRLSKDGSSIEEDEVRVRSYYERMANKFSGLVNVWQFFNEADDHRYADYGRIENNQVYPDGYLENFGKLVNVANETVKKIDPKAKTTINVSLWNNPSGDQWIDPAGNITPRFEEVALFDSVCGYVPGGEVANDCATLDYISLDLYFDTDYAAIEKLPDLVAYFKSRYGKPVVISEVGIPTGGDGRFTPLDQAKSISKIIDVLQAGVIRPDSILLYEMRDEYMKAESDPEGHFGFEDYYGKPKEGWNEVVNAIEVDDGDE